MYENKNIKLKIEHLTKIYAKSDKKAALNDISFEVKSGEFLSVLGPSGCGKSTLLRLIAGLEEPTTGKIYKDGTDITNYRPSERSLGIVFQNYALFENMTVLDNVRYAALLKAKRENKDESAVTEKANELLALLGLAELAKKYPNELSGGQQQRVAIARTLILTPEILLFDEPMSALDAATRLQLRELILDIKKRFSSTIIYVTHDQEEAFSMSDRILVMETSRLCRLDTPENILKNPQSEYIKSFVVDNLRRKIDALSRLSEMMI